MSFTDTNEKYLTAIFLVPDGINGAVSGKKYRNIKNQTATVNGLIAAIKKKFPNAISVNFYGKQSRQFITKIYLQ